MKKTLVAAIAALWAVAALAADKKATGEFSALATVNTASGTRSMAFDVVVMNPRSLADVQPLKKVLAQGGQQALLNAIRGGGQGQIKLGGLVYPVDLVVAEKIDAGWRYFIVTARPIRTGEAEQDGGESLNYPFAVFGFDATDWGSGDGVIYTRAALSVDDDGRVHVAQYDGDPGKLTDIRRVN